MRRSRTPGRAAILAIAALLASACNAGGSPSNPVATTPVSSSASPPISQASSSAASSNAPASTAVTDFGGETLTINTGGGTSEALRVKYLVTPFDAMYNAKINLVPALTTDVIAKVEAERANPEFDIVDVEATAIADLGNVGLILPLDAAKIPNLNELVPGSVGPGNLYVDYHLFADAIAYNTDKIKTPPTSYQDLFNPAYAGHVFISGFNGCCGLPFLLELNHMAGADYHTTVDPGFAKLAALKPNLLTVLANQDQGAQLLNSGDAWIGEYASDRTGQQMNAGAHIGIAYSTTGLLLQADTMAIVKGTKHEALAEAFLNFLLSAGPQGDWGSAALNFPVNKNSTLTAAAQKLLLSPADIANGIPSDLAFIATQRAAWLDRWTRLFGG